MLQEMILIRFQGSIKQQFENHSKKKNQIQATRQSTQVC